MSVAIDGTSLLTNTAVSSTTWTAYSATPPAAIAAGTHSLSISFTNDYATGGSAIGKSGKFRPGCDRNLYADVTNFYGPTTITPAPTVTLSASPTSVTTGQSSTLTWASTNATSCNATGAWSITNLPTSGSQSTGALNQTSTYSLTCTGDGGSATASATVTVGIVTTDKLTWAPPGYSTNYSVYTQLTLADTGPIIGAPYNDLGYQHIIHLDNNTDYVIHLHHRQVAAGAGIAGISFVGGRNIVIIGGEVTGPMQASPTLYNAANGGSAYNQYGMAFYQNQGTVHIEGVKIDGFFLAAFYFADNSQFGGPAHDRIQIENVRAMNTLMWKEDQTDYDHSDTYHWAPMNGTYQTIYIDKFTGNYDQTGFALYPNAVSGGFIQSVYLKRTNLRADSLFGSGAGQCTGAGLNGGYAGNYMFQYQATKLTLDQFYVTLGYHRAGAGIGKCPAEESTTRALINDFTTYNNDGTLRTPSYTMTGNQSPGPSVPGDTLTFTNPSADNIWAPDGVHGGVVTDGIPPGGDFVPDTVPGTNYVSPGYQ
jgi:hypothetical protein